MFNTKAEFCFQADIYADRHIGRYTDRHTLTEMQKIRKSGWKTETETNKKKPDRQTDRQNIRQNNRQMVPKLIPPTKRLFIVKVNIY